MSQLSTKSSDYVRTINAMREAESYGESRPKLSGGVFTDSPFVVNNLELYQHLRQELTYDNFKEIFSIAEKKGVFNLIFHHSVPAVTEAAGAKHMTRKWPRDSMGMIELIKDRYPEQLVSGLTVMAKTYANKTEMDAFARVLQKPNCFKKNDGIAHVFWQNQTKGTLYRDKKWHVNQRIESHGEFLRVLAEYMTDYQGDEKNIPTPIVKVMTYMVHYLHCLGTSPQTCGPWEEIPFPKGSNWDSASVVGAFETVQKMLDKIGPTLKKRLYITENYLCHKFSRQPLLQNPVQLARFCEKANQKIASTYMDEFHGCTNREDSSSVMLAASDVCLDKNVVEDTKKRLQILEKFERKLLGQYGARRYGHFQISLPSGYVDSCDSYLQKNYNILIDNADLTIKKSKKDWIKFQEAEGNDASKAKGFTDRALHCDEVSSAQWGLPVSYAAIAFAKMVKRLKHLKEPTAESKKLLTICQKGQEYYIKRCYASISGYRLDGSIPVKADGTPSIPWRKPEAYQTVSFYHNPRKWGFLPGVNSHLGWDAAKCWEASRLVLENLRS